MKRSVRTSFLIFALMLSYNLSSAQEDYVVTVLGDTLKGKIKIINFGEDKKVQITDSQKTKTQVTIFKTRVFSYKGDLFNPVKTETGYQYMKLLKSGYLSLYAFIPEKQSAYDGRYLLKRDGTGMELPNLSFKRMMTKFLGDCVVLADKIENGEIAKKDLDKIIDEYNKCIDDKSHVHLVAQAVQAVPEKSTASWDALEEKVKAHADFEGKSNALDMITEIKNKVKKSEKIPNFLSEGLTSTLSKTDLKDEVAKVLNSNP